MLVCLSNCTLRVTSRKVVLLFREQLWLELVPAFHRLQGGLAAQGPLRELLVIQLNARTPTLSTGARFFIDGTLGLADRFMSMR